MASRKPKTSYRECEHCHTRLLLIKGVPALNWVPDAGGKVAVTIADPRRGRFLARDEQPDPLEKRYVVHECDGSKRAAQRGQWTAAQSQHARDRRSQRGKRRPQQYGELPGMTRLPRKTG